MMMMQTQNKRIKPKGDISSVFSHLGGKETVLDSGLLQLKKEIAPKDPAVLDQAYQRLMDSFAEETPEIKAKGSSIIPQVTMEDIQANNGQFPPAIAAQIKNRGCVVIRNVIPELEARGYKDQIQQYIGRHAGEIEGFPKNDPQVWEVYWSHSQVAARSHPRFDMATLALNKLWHASEEAAIDLTKNLGYCDRLRIRKPGNESFALQEHIDSGSIERKKYIIYHHLVHYNITMFLGWQDPEYRKCYTDIFNGEWEVIDKKQGMF
jgi:hypothetical protein